MEVSGQLQVPVTLHWAKKQIRIGKKKFMGSRVGFMFLRKEILMPLPGFEDRTVQPHSLVAFVTTLPRFLKYCFYIK
jgi:hypothetical protein